MEPADRLNMIKHYFLQIKRLHDWAKTHGDKEYQEMFNQALKILDDIYEKLEKLGVNKEFSAALFVMDVRFDKMLVDQYKE